MYNIKFGDIIFLYLWIWETNVCGTFKRRIKLITMVHVNLALDREATSPNGGLHGRVCTPAGQEIIPARN